MSTKDFCLNNYKFTGNISNYDSQYNNLNLNGNKIYSTTNLIHSKSVSGFGNKEKTEGYCNNDYYSPSNNRTNLGFSWKKDDRSLKPFQHLEIFGSQKDRKDKWDKRHKNICDNGISLHIKCYENSMKDQSGNKEMEEKVGKKHWKNAKQLLENGPVLMNNFEFPRQQENQQQQSNPEVMQFKASQKLRNPDRNQDVNSFYAILDEQLKENFEKTSGGLHWKPKGIIERAALTAVTTKFMESLFITKFIDAGSYGSVSECKIPECKQTCAMKTMTNFLNTEDIKAELDALLLGTHCAFIPKLLYSGFNQQNSFCIVMECLSGGTLFEHINNPALTPDAIRVIALHVAKALCFLHKNHYTHGDLKAENVGLNVHGFAKVMDFGKSRNVSTPRVLPNGTYDAPEIIKGEPADTVSDWFSYGCMIGFVIQKIPPYFHKTTSIMQKAILNDEPIIRIEDGTSRQFVMDLLEKDPKKRLTEVLKHEYLKVKTEPLFKPGNFLQSISAPKESIPLAPPKKHNIDLIINEKLIIFPTKKCIHWMNAR